MGSGAVDFAFESVAAAQPLIQSGMLRLLAISSAERLPGIEAPRVAEAAGLSGYAVYGTGGLMAPARTPPEVIAELYAGFGAVMADALVQSRMMEAGLPPMAEGPEAFARFIYAERAKWVEVARKG
jgi:tripartite-type tricarboxylate transporter receptor subunit TctC